MAKLLMGKEVSARIKAELKEETEELKKQGINPGLAVIIVGEDPASQVYVKNKERACEECGIYSEKYALPDETTEDELLKLIDTLNKKSDISGILVQLPVPKHIDEKTIINAIDPKKDVDAFHPVNVGKIMVGNYDFVPCTPAGVMELIKESGIDVSGKECVVVGRSNIVGKPQAMLLLHENGTVTICHSRTKDLKEKTKNADILVAAVGIPNFITGDMIKDGAVVIDVGINRLENKKLCGDVEFESAEKVAGAITPVPGGVGPMTIAMLMKNTVKAARVNKTGKENNMTNKEILDIALRQSAYDCNCRAEDFLKNFNVVTLSKKNDKARSYLPLPFECDLVSYGNNIVAQVSERTEEVVTEFIEKYPHYRCFETPNIYKLNEKLNKFGLKVCFMAEYFLPDVTKLKRIECDYRLKILRKNDFADLYKPEWSNALCAERRKYDVLGVGAYDGDKLVGLAGCSADCEDMYQIGVDVLPEYRRKGIASALTSNLAMEIIELGKVPFYCAAWSNIKSVRNAVKCGFRPAWTELTARSNKFIDKILK